MFKKLFHSRRSGRSNQSGVGGRGEDDALKYLRSKGYAILEQNWYNKVGKRLGEVDIIARDDDSIIFVEVKSRCSRQSIQGSAANTQSVLPQENITPQKLQKISKVAQVYIKEQNLWQMNWRVDAITVVYHEKAEPQIVHLENIFY